MSANPPEAGPSERLYNEHAGAWVRTQPTSLSDFTARPALLELCLPLIQTRVLDLGCGEGYCTRMLKRAGAQAVLGIDSSAAMIEAAQVQELKEPLGLQFQCADATDLHWLEAGEFDLVLAVFLFNYLECKAMRRCMSEVARLLRPGGRFVFAVPHPLFPYVRRPAPPFFFEVGTAGYYTGRDHRFAGKIWKRDGSELEVQLVHKTIADYFDALRLAGFDTLPILEELTVTPEIAAIDREFFAPLSGTPLHLAFSLRR
jgi:SAM-dependent methyltransferase